MKKSILISALLLLALRSFSQTIVADYNFSGGAANDISGNGLNGILSTTGVTSVAGQAGTPNTALLFDTGYVRVPYDSLLNLTTWTVMASVKFLSFYNGHCQGNSIMNRGTQFGPDNIMLVASDNFYDGDCSIYTPNFTTPYGQAAGTGSSIDTPTYFLDTNWHCITATYGNDTLNTYVDGILIISQRWHFAYNYAGRKPDMYFGGIPTSVSFPYWFHGIMDRLTIWNGILSPTQISSECGNNECSVKDIEYCSKVSDPLTYTFTPTVSPSTASIHWTYGDGSGVDIEPANAAVTHTYSSTGSYQVCATVYVDKEECSQVCIPLCISKVFWRPSDNSSKNTTNVKTVKSIDIVGDIYPNPAKSELNIPVLASPGKIEINVYSIDGMKLRSQTAIHTTGTGNVIVPIADLKPGNYTVEIFDGRGRTVRMFSKI